MFGDRCISPFPLSLSQNVLPPTRSVVLTEEQLSSKVWTAQGLLYCALRLEIAVRLV